MVELKYQAEIDVSNFNNSHTLAYHFVSAVGRAGLRVLEVGCSSGYFGAALKRVGHHVVGVEPDAHSAQHAAGELDEVFCGFVEDFFAANPGRRFDVIVFGDVLEHLTDPASVLRLARQFLAPEGRVIASVPNVGHASVRAMLLDGEWSYGELGILDRTHLRFFSKKSLIELFNQSGFAIEYLQPVRLPTMDAANMAGLSLSASSVKQVEAVKDDDTLHDFQYVVSALPGEERPVRVERLSRKQVLKVMVLSDDPSSTITQIRLGCPLRRLSWAEGFDLKFASIDDFSALELQWGEVFVMQRGYSRKALQAAMLIRSAGKPLVYEVDDLITAIPDFLSHHSAIRKSKGKIQECLAMANVVSVSTSRLAQALRLPPAKVAVCPNYARACGDVARSLAAHHENGPVSLVVAASDKVIVEFLVEPIRALLKKYGSRVSFVCIGAIAERFEAEGVPGIYHPIVPYDEFGALVANLSNPVGVIPLDDSEFSSCKSAVKYFDYTQAGLPVICSNVPPYSDVVTSGEDGLLVDNTVEAWVDAMSRLVDDVSLRRAMVSAAQARLEADHALGGTVEAWRQVLERVAPQGRTVRWVPGFSMPKQVRINLISARMQLKELNRKRRVRRKLAKDRVR